MDDMLLYVLLSEVASERINRQGRPRRIHGGTVILSRAR